MKLDPHRKSGVTICIIAICWTILSVGIIHACGIDWSEPKSYFDGVDYQGHVHVIDKLSELELGSGESLPIYIIFNSANSVSPYGGAFEIPLLESKIVQVDDSIFSLRSPSGWRLLFRRSKDRMILDGNVGWKAEISGDKITAWSECGSKMVFNKGRLVRLESKNIKLDYVYSGDRVSEIREGNKSLLKVNVDARSGIVRGLSMGLDRSISFEWGKKPRVDFIGGQKIIGAVETSLSKIILANGAVRSYEYGVTPQMDPTIKIIDGKIDKLAIWNPVSKHIIAFDKWKYSIKPGINLNENAQIDRVDDKEQRESWFYDAGSMEETILRIDGTTIVKSWFSSGPLSNAPRKIVKKLKDGSVQIISQMIYDEKGRLIRSIKTQPDGSTSEIYKNTYDNNGRLLTREENGGKLTVVYDNSGNVQAIQKDGKNLWAFTRKNNLVVAVNENKQ